MLRNNVKTVVLLTAMAALFMAIGSLFGQGGLVIGLLLGLVFVGGSYWFSDSLAIRAARAVPVSEAEAPQLYAIVRDLANRGGMPMPRVFVSPAEQPNAFATGRNPQHAAVAVTCGLL
ncbi:MAG: M48 family metalloprotease, partial [Actinomycetota bacterium]